MADSTRRVRVRVEVNASRGKWLEQKIKQELEKVPVDSDDFKELFPLYCAISSQLKKIEAK